MVIQYNNNSHDQSANISFETIERNQPHKKFSFVRDKYCQFPQSFEGNKLMAHLW